MGKTITTDTKTGTIIIALLAVCTSLATNHLWNLLAFIYHQYRANGRPSNGLFRQQQALLRTLPTPSSLLAETLKLFYNWGQVKAPQKRKTIFQLFPETVLGILFVIGSLAAAIFSSAVLKSSDLEVLVDSPFCGKFFKPDKSANTEEYSLGYNFIIDSTASRYALECYEEKSVLPVRCNTIFTRKTVPFSKEDVPCPFSPDICASPSIAFDTGLLDLNDVFGFNLEDHDRVKYRKKSTCAILSLKGRTRVMSYEDIVREFGPAIIGRQPLPSEEWLSYRFGKTKGSTNESFILSLASSKLTRGITTM